MSLETLLEAARFLELQELKQQRIAAKTRTVSISKTEDEPYRNGHAIPERERISSVGSDRSIGRASLSLEDHSMLHKSTEDILQSPVETNRRRTNSASLGPCILRSGTREVHNKLEKNRRAHLKECFELLKKQLPASPDEKKTSNLSILGSAIRYIQLLRRKEREYEHEMERLAREKIAGQQKLMALRKELSAQWEHIDFSALLPEEPLINNVTDRETPAEPPAPSNLGLRTGPRYSSSSSLSSAATAPSPSTATLNPIQATMSLTSQSTIPPATSPSHISTALASIYQSNGGPPKLISSTQNPIIITTSHNNTKGNNISSNVFSNNKQINNNKLHPNNSLINTQVITSTSNLLHNHNKGRIMEPPVKLMNGTSLALTQIVSSADAQKDGKVHHPITLSRVVGGGGLVVSPIQLLTTQGIRVLGSAPLAATLELATSATPQHLRDTTITSTAQLHKLLVPQNCNAAETALGGRLPGGAELNLLPKATPTLYHPAKGLAIVNNGITLKTTVENNGSRAVHMVTPLSSTGAPLSGLTPLVVSQGQGGQVAHIIATPSQLAGKVVTTPLLKPLVNAQYLSTALVKPMVVVSTSSSLVQAPPTSSG